MEEDVVDGLINDAEVLVEIVDTRALVVVERMDEEDNNEVEDGVVGRAEETTEEYTEEYTEVDGSGVDSDGVIAEEIADDATTNVLEGGGSTLEAGRVVAGSEEIVTLAACTYQANQNYQC